LWATPATHPQEHDNGWLKLEAGAFSIYAPSGWEFHEKQGVDSYLGEFAGAGIVPRLNPSLIPYPISALTGEA